MLAILQSSVDKILHAYPALGNYRSYVALLVSQRKIRKNLKCGRVRGAVLL